MMTTVGSEEEGVRLAKSLVGQRLCACVNLVPGVRSIYRWRDAVEDDAEVLLIMKTTKEKRGRLSRHLAENHAYDVPEALSLPVDAGGASYLAWLADACAD